MDRAPGASRDPDTSRAGPLLDPAATRRDTGIRGTARDPSARLPDDRNGRTRTVRGRIGRARAVLSGPIARAPTVRIAIVRLTGRSRSARASRVPGKGRPVRCPHPISPPSGSSAPFSPAIKPRPRCSRHTLSACSATCTSVPRPWAISPGPRAPIRAAWKRSWTASSAWGWYTGTAPRTCSRARWRPISSPEWTATPRVSWR
jgi:hypothetical protein